MGTHGNQVSKAPSFFCMCISRFVPTSSVRPRSRERTIPKRARLSLPQGRVAVLEHSKAICSLQYLAPMPIIYCAYLACWTILLFMAGVRVEGSRLLEHRAVIVSGAAPSAVEWRQGTSGEWRMRRRLDVALLADGDPTMEPSQEPTPEPTSVPSPDPTLLPSAKPTALPTQLPTASPSPAPTTQPTPQPTAAAGILQISFSLSGISSITDTVKSSVKAALAEALGLSDASLVQSCSLTSSRRLRSVAAGSSRGSAESPTGVTGASRSLLSVQVVAVVAVPTAANAATVSSSLAALATNFAASYLNQPGGSAVVMVNVQTINISPTTSPSAVPNAPAMTERDDTTTVIIACVVGVGGGILCVAALLCFAYQCRQAQLSSQQSQSVQWAAHGPAELVRPQLNLSDFDDARALTTIDGVRGEDGNSQQGSRQGQRGHGRDDDAIEVSGGGGLGLGLVKFVEEKEVECEPKSAFELLAQPWAWLIGDVERAKSPLEPRPDSERDEAVLATGGRQRGAQRFAARQMQAMGEVVPTDDAGAISVDVRWAAVGEGVEGGAHADLRGQHGPADAYASYAYDMIPPVASERFEGTSDTDTSDGGDITSWFSAAACVTPGRAPSSSAASSEGEPDGIASWFSGMGAEVERAFSSHRPAPAEVIPSTLPPSAPVKPRTVVVARTPVTVSIEGAAGGNPTPTPAPTPALAPTPASTPRPATATFVTHPPEPITRAGSGTKKLRLKRRVRTDEDEV